MTINKETRRALEPMATSSQCKPGTKMRFNGGFRDRVLVVPYYDESIISPKPYSNY